MTHYSKETNWLVLFYVSTHNIFLLPAILSTIVIMLNDNNVYADKRLYYLITSID